MTASIKGTCAVCGDVTVPAYQVTTDEVLDAINELKEGLPS